jgi:hypothetical protein
MKKDGSKQNRNTKKVLPTKKFPELKLMINGEYRNSNNTLSSEDDSLAVSPLSLESNSLMRIVPTNQKNLTV